MRAHFPGRVICAAMLAEFWLGGCGPTSTGKAPGNAALERGTPLPGAAGAGLSDENATLVRDAAFMKPESERLAEFRSWAAGNQSLLLTLEGLQQLAWAQDAAGFDATLSALARSEPEVIEQAALAVAEYGPPASARAIEALLAALQRAEPRSRPTLVWTLVELGEPRALEPALALYVEGKLERVQRLGGAPAFDLGRLAALLPEARAAELCSNPAVLLRRLCPARLGQAPNPARRELLTSLLGDPDLEVSRWAALALGRLGAVETLAAAMRRSAATRRNDYVEALARGVGVAGVLSAAVGLESEPEEARFVALEQLFKTVRQRADPRGGDALERYIQGKPHHHFETQAGFALAEIGDLRAVPALGHRLELDPQKAYAEDKPWQRALSRDDAERLQAARFIAELAELHPSKKDQLREQSEKALFAWARTKKPLPAEAMRALAAIGSQKGLPLLRAAADPNASSASAADWAAAAMALRYLGKARDAPSFGLLVRALGRQKLRREPEVAQSLAIGAAQGLSDWRDPRGFQPLLEVADDERAPAGLRQAACSALAWISSAEQSADLAKKARDAAPGSERGTCLLKGLSEHAFATGAPLLVAMLSAPLPLELRFSAAHALGRAGFDPALEKQLFELVEDAKFREPAALALLLGGRSEVALRVVATLIARSPESRARLEREWKNASMLFFTDDLDSGTLLRRVSSAEAISKVTLGPTRQTWARSALCRALDDLPAEQVPHSASRVMLRYTLSKLTKEGDPATRAAAIQSLGVLRERGVLLALAERDPQARRLAERALSDLALPRSEP